MTASAAAAAPAARNVRRETDWAALIEGVVVGKFPCRGDRLACREGVRERPWKEAAEAAKAGESVMDGWGFGNGDGDDGWRKVDADEEQEKGGRKGGRRKERGNERGKEGGSEGGGVCG